MPPHLFACVVDGKHIFLDLERDRYFRLPEAEAAAFAALLEPGAGCEPPALQVLVERGVLVTEGGNAPGLTDHVLPKASLLETLDVTGRPSLWLPDLVEVAALVQAARRAVARRRLPRAFAGIAAARKSGSLRHDADRRDRLTGRFLAARSLLPLPAKCLHDTLALSRFLARRRVQADLVIGVKLHPFGAHCWLQDGTVVLNDTLGSARDYRAVLVA